MNRSEKKLETFANIAVIIVAVSIMAVLAHKYFSGSPETTKLKPGAVLSVPNTDWSGQKQTLILVLQKGCHFCTESAPFYQKLNTTNQVQNRIQIMAVLPNSTAESKNYLKELGIEISEIRQANPGSIGVSGTPTLILVDEQGKVIEFWIGKLDAESEEKVLQKIFCNESEGCS